jgi:DNA invertase Pin-like site-specific DNA recombinase
MVSDVKNCVLYARLSVTKEESVSIERQLRAGRKYAEGRGWAVVGEFIDDGVSATANRPEDRKGWAALLESSDFQAVVVWKIDRLARKVLDFLHVDEVLRGRGAGLVAVEDPIDMTTPMGRAFATILAVFGEMEAAAIASRVRAARSHLLAEGRWTGGGIPYGYMPIDNPDGPGKILTHDPERIEWLRRMISLAQHGKTINGIAIWLDRHAAPLPVAASKLRDRRPRTWNRQSVDGILRNPINAGATRHNPGKGKTGPRSSAFNVLRDDDGKPVLNDNLAVISWEAFSGLVADLDSKVTPQAAPFVDRQRTSSFLSKVARCDDCDVFLCRGTNQKRPVLYCPSCRQVIGRAHLDPYLEELLLAERGRMPLAGRTVRDHWQRAWGSDEEKRAVFRSQIDSLRIRRGVAGRRFDADRVLIQWRTPGEVA